MTNAIRLSETTCFFTSCGPGISSPGSTLGNENTVWVSKSLSREYFRDFSEFGSKGSFGGSINIGALGSDCLPLI
ncbi:hypothetical protein HanXRQr2_Chr16g0777471 [Helianthus annuus]|uniref:Uncharacterized protein n=1 Tax=Helianthus annuus TaxID=4232 RepID=A0A9K3H0F2_HELAN|nr:hypothetical protein HanXRQr2_Chr16g0777471 [Helianthus annuus]KAJ0823618.1 hypothetical protein HanPSC8_Chr16g0745811 [Helianthus annuus]